MKKKSIWIIDDDTIFKFIMLKLISKTDKFDDVNTFSNGQEALIEFKNIVSLNEKLPDIILLDIEMPVMDGWGFMSEVNRIKKNHKELKTSIFMSSSSIAFDDQLKADENPDIMGYLAKPITLDDLIKIAS